MKPGRMTLASAAILLCMAAGALVLAFAGGDGDQPRSAEGRAAARPAASVPVEFALEPAHDSGVSGTARLVSAGAEMTVTLTLRERVPGTLLAHIHSGPCSREPTWKNPRITATLTEVIDGRSTTTVNVVTLQEVRTEVSSINVHDPEHNNRPLVCGDVPPAS